MDPMLVLIVVVILFIVMNPMDGENKLDDENHS